MEKSTTLPMPTLHMPDHRFVPIQGKHTLTIGSDPTCDLPVQGPGVAARHLLIQPREQGWQAATLQLHTPFYVNGRPVYGLALLQDGDSIRIGEDVTLVWHEQLPIQAQQGPWLGLLLILLSILAGLAILFAIFRFDAPPARPAPAAIHQPMRPAATSPEGHPVYRLVIPRP